MAAPIQETVADVAKMQHWAGLMGPRKVVLTVSCALMAVVVAALLVVGAVDLRVGVVVIAASAALVGLNVRERLQVIESTTRQIVEEGRDLVRDGHYQRAVERLNEALLLDPGNDQVYLLMSAMRRTTQDNDGALSLLLKAVMEKPSARNHYHLALAYIEGGEYRAGMEQLMAALECDEFFLDAYYMLGFLYEAERRTGKALRCYEEMIWMADHWPPRRSRTNQTNLEKARLRLATLSRHAPSEASTP